MVRSSCPEVEGGYARGADGSNLCNDATSQGTKHPTNNLNPAGEEFDELRDDIVVHRQISRGKK